MSGKRLIGVVVLLVAAWQFYSFFRGFNTLRTKSNKGTTAFTIFGTWYGLLFAVILLGFGITFVLNGF